MHIIKVRFRTNREFTEAYDDKELPGGGLFCPTTTPFQEGDSVIAEVSVPVLPNKILLRGKVRSWRPALPRLRVRAGAMIEINPEEAGKRDYILDMISGVNRSARKRKYTRLPVKVPVRWRRSDSTEFHDAALSEISVGGALLRGPGKVPLGTKVIIEVTLPGAVSPIEISGKVTYHTEEPSSGVRFVYRDGGGSRRLRELVRRLKDL